MHHYFFFWHCEEWVCSCRRAARGGAWRMDWRVALKKQVLPRFWSPDPALTACMFNNTIIKLSDSTKISSSNGRSPLLHLHILSAYWNYRHSFNWVAFPPHRYFVVGKFLLNSSKCFTMLFCLGVALLNHIDQHT